MPIEGNGATATTIDSYPVVLCDLVLKQLETA